MTTPSTSKPKPGFLTSEFWLVVAFTALAQLQPLIHEIDLGPWAQVANAIVISIYAMSRTKAKSVGVVLPILVACLFLGLTSCMVTIDPDTGKPKLGIDPDAAATVVDQVNNKIIDATK